MKIVLSRKGFDTSRQGGGGPSPIVDGRPVSLPIPAIRDHSRTTYAQLGLGELAEAASRGRITGADFCHHDPMFLPDGRALLGQCGGAQTHLARHGVGPGDLFVFFGLFRETGGRPHHRIFGYLRVAKLIHLASAGPTEVRELAVPDFPHLLGMHAANDVIYSGAGRSAASAPDALRLTIPEGPPTRWRVPAWLHRTGLSWHPPGKRWSEPERLTSVSRGQEFVADIGGEPSAQLWADEIVALIEERG